MLTHWVWNVNLYVSPIKEEASPLTGMLCGEWEGLKCHIYPSTKKKNPPCSWKAKQGKIHVEIPVFEWSVAATSYCCLPAPQSRANRDECPRRQLVHQQSMTNASANTSKQAAEHVNIIFYHFYLMWIGQKIWDAGHDVDFQNWLAVLGHWKPFLWHFNAELKLISAIEKKKMRTKLRHINHRLGEDNNLGSHMRSVVLRPHQRARSCRRGCKWLCVAVD